MRDYSKELRCFADNNKKNGNKVRFYYTKNGGNTPSIGKRLQLSLAAFLKPITTPFACTLPKPAWDVMLRRTNTVFRRECDFNEDSGYGKQGTGALSVFLRKFEDRFKNELREKSIEITLIGHSMGAIIVNKMINLHPDLPYRNIVHMASADSMRNFIEIVVPYMKKHDYVNFYSLSLHPKNENREENYGGVVPSGSLLVWIDNMYTTPETIMDRRSGRWDNMKRVIHMISAAKEDGRSKLPAVMPVDMPKCQAMDDKGTKVSEQLSAEITKAPLDRMHFKVFGIGNTCEPQEHGGFDEYDGFWNKPYWWKKDIKPAV
uniref:Uncharacterized protein n=1 Tax=Candidatus Kentrum sp. LFY TaxID=2126342 RepID=A0A450WKM1_9GAMM|nr:MAG: hypothetical protein BECKLFY1418C_GA0070996_103320 [Candidatus Kentron sp. LFY]